MSLSQVYHSIVSNLFSVFWKHFSILTFPPNQSCTLKPNMKGNFFVRSFWWWFVVIHYTLTETGGTLSLVFSFKSCSLSVNGALSGSPLWDFHITSPSARQEDRLRDGKTDGQLCLNSGWLFIRPQAQAHQSQLVTVKLQLSSTYQKLKHMCTCGKDGLF